MPSYLIKNQGDGSYRNEDFPGLLPRNKEESYVPWAVTSNGQVVYARSGAHRDRVQGNGLRAYNGLVSKERRKTCQSELGSIALRNPQFSAGGVGTVSLKWRFLLNKAFYELSARQKAAELHEVANVISTVLYDANNVSWGALPETRPTGGHADEEVVRRALEVLTDNTPLPTVIALHDKLMSGLTREPFTVVPPQTTDKYREWIRRFGGEAPGEWFDGAWRGRTRAQNVVPTDMPGIMPQQYAGDIPNVGAPRNRGVDTWNRGALPAHPVPSAALSRTSGKAYYDDLDRRNELFGAGPSGTTRTILAAAMALADLRGDALKQYLFGVIGHIVGGGHHGLHEALIMLKAFPPEYRMEYNPGSLLHHGLDPVTNRVVARAEDLPALPAAFLQSSLFTGWRHKYYDIVVLGGIHWIFNQF